VSKLQSKLEYEKSEFNKFDQAKYQIKIKTNKKGKIKQLRVTYTIYPLLSHGYDNNEELNVNITRLIKYHDIEIYFIKESWNGDGYDPICHQRSEFPDEFFNFIVQELTTNGDVRSIVLRLFKQLKSVIQTSGRGGDCYYATYYFPI
jgi:hypothetical protein